MFGHTGNEDITEVLLLSIIKDKISDISVDCNPITEKDLLDDKVGILDIKVKINNNLNCNIEMQVVDKKNIENQMCRDFLRKSRTRTYLRNAIILKVFK